MIARKLVPYTNSKGEDRVLVVFQDNQESADQLLFATESQSTKIGTVVLRNGITMEQAVAQNIIGRDFSATFAFGEPVADQDAKYDGKLHEINPA